MIPVYRADSILQQKLPFFGTETISFENALTRVLAENILCDRDLPPFDRVAMDGIAIAYDSLIKTNGIFKIEDMQKAGDPAKKISDINNHCIEVMTGAILPIGADTVIRYEDIDIENHTAYLHKDVNIKKNANIHVQGSDKVKDSLVVPIGQRINSADLGIIASVGKKFIKVQKLPSIAVVSTGNELVEVDDEIKEHQIRRSNVYSISACLTANGFPVTKLFHLNDEQENIHATLPAILENHDVIILSGGVSMGKFDFIPKSLLSLGIEEKFHQIRQKPGKPFWYGTNDKKFVYALPGNPVSTLLCLIRYVIPHLKQGSGISLVQRVAYTAQEFSFTKPITSFYPVFVSQNTNAQLIATPVQTNGSGDFAALQGSDGFIEFDEYRSIYPAGSIVPFYSWIS